MVSNLLEIEERERQRRNCHSHSKKPYMKIEKEQNKS